MWWALVLACRGKDAASDSGADDPPLQGVVAAVRTASGDPVFTGGVVAGGGSDAKPDSQATVYFYDLLPGRSPLYGEDVGQAWAVSVPEVFPETLSGASLVYLPISDEQALDGALGGEAAFDGVTVTWASDTLTAPGGGPLGSWTQAAVRARAATRAAIPAEQLMLDRDVDLVPVAIHEAFFVDGTTDAGRPEFTADRRAAVTVSLDADSPLLTDGESLRVVSFERTRGHWVSITTPTVDVGAATASFELATFGWIALVTVLDELPCVAGTTTAGGRPVGGVEIRSLRAGQLGVDRVSSDVTGSFCLPAAPGDAFTFTAVGFDATLDTLYAGSGAGAAADGGIEVELEAWSDGDGDHAFDGPGGDCDDRDENVSPNPVYGDGSWCGSAL